MNIKLSDIEKIKILNSTDMFDVMQRVLRRENKIDREKEHFWIIGLNTINKILFVELVSIGSVKAAKVEPMNVFRVAVLKGAVKVILVHNHPSGSIKATVQDKELTDRLFQVGRILAIDVIEHLIITLQTYMSFADTGLLEKLSKSTKWVPSFELEARIREEEKKIREEAVKFATEKGVKKGIKKGKKEGKAEGLKEGEEKGILKGEKKKSLEMARGMLSRGLSVDVVAEISGLKREEVESVFDVEVKVTQSKT